METKKLTAYYIDPETATADPVEITAALDTYYELLHCNIIDIVTRKIGGKYYDIICDDEGLFNADPRISAIDPNWSAMLVGALLVIGLPDDEGNETSLSEDDVAHIASRVLHMGTRNHPEGWYMLTDVEY